MSDGIYSNRRSPAYVKSIGYFTTFQETLDPSLEAVICNNEGDIICKPIQITFDSSSGLYRAEYDDEDGNRLVQYLHCSHVSVIFAPKGCFDE